MGEGSRGLGRNQQGLQVGCWAMMGDYSDDSYVQGELESFVTLDSGRGKRRLEKTRTRVS